MRSYIESLTKWISSSRIKLRSKEAAEFCRSFQTLLEAKIPIADTIQMLKESTKNRKLKDRLNRVYFRLLNGHSLFYSFKAEGFPDIIVDGIRTGESTGNIEEILSYLKVYYERENKIKSKIQQAMLYPSLLISIAVAAVILISIFVMPSFVDIFYDFDVEPPPMTKLVINLSRYCSDHWLQGLTGLAITMLFVMTFGKNSHIKYIIDSIKIRVPYFKTINQKIVISRFTGLLSIHIGGSQFLCDALEMAALSSGNKVYEKSIFRVSNELKNGVTFERALEVEKIYPKLMIYMSRLGSNSGSYEEVMRNIAAVYENEAFISIEKATLLIEPAILIFIAGLALVLGFAVLMPVYDILDNVIV